MKFSVLMSVYKKENPDYLRIALNSVLVEQTLLPTEVIIVEDGPLTAPLYLVLNEFKKKFPIIKTVSLKKNMGLGAALNEGLKHCRYEWIARMDSDDVAVNNRFEIQLNYLKKYPSLDLLGGSIIEFGTGLDDIKSHKIMPTAEKDIINYSKTRNPFCHMTILFKKTAVLDAGGYQHLPYVEDYYLWVRMLAANKRVANVPDILVYARVGNGMAERRSNRVQIVSWKVLNDFMLGQKMITKMTYVKNMISIRLFVYIPASIKKIIYKHILR
ncbi:TPA: glycosyltransferase [Streptococcus suis]|nr:glycosyltransferase [Streptococcus suis]